MVSIKLLSFPGRDGILETEFGGMAISFYVVVILLMTLDVHVSGIPITCLNGRLRTPMCPNTELCIVIPVRNLISSERGPGANKRTFIYIFWGKNFTSIFIAVKCRSRI